MWPWLMITAGALLIVGALVARHRMMRESGARLAQLEPGTDEPTPARQRVTSTEPPFIAGPLFADLPIGHRLTSPPTIRVRAQDVPLQDWLRHYAHGNAWSGVIQSISDRITGDRELQRYVGSLDRPTLQRHVMSTVMMVTGEGVTVGAVRRYADAHLQHVQTGGDPVTEEVWDRLTATFANALREHLVPEAAVLRVDDTVAPLKSVLVARRSG